MKRFSAMISGVLESEIRVAPKRVFLMNHLQLTIKLFLSSGANLFCMATYPPCSECT